MAAEDHRVAQTGTQEILGRVFSNGIAVLTINRPKALNAMNLDMDVAYKQLIDEWAHSDEVKAVVIEGSTGRAFSSGGDVKWMATTGREKHNPEDMVQEVFQTEYSLICRISRFSKPYLSLMEGVTMGFGIGLSGHGKYRIVTEKTLLAMPENKIGLFPDVGFAHLVSTSQEKAALGAYLALTGSRIANPADALFSGIGTHFVPSEKLPFLKDALLSLNLGNDPEASLEKLLGKFLEDPKEIPSLEPLLPSILEVFGPKNSVEQILENLQKLEASEDKKVSKWASDALTAMSAMSPFSLKVTRHHFLQVAEAANGEGSNLDLAQIEGVMKQEYRLAVRMTLREDFVEGVRAVLVDKDQNPHWRPKSLADLQEGEVEGIFAPLGDGFHELQLTCETEAM